MSKPLMFTFLWFELNWFCSVLRAVYRAVHSYRTGAVRISIIMVLDFSVLMGAVINTSVRIYGTLTNCRGRLMI